MSQNKKPKRILIENFVAKVKRIKRKTIILETYASGELIEITSDDNEQMEVGEILIIQPEQLFDISNICFGVKKKIMDVGADLVRIMPSYCCYRHTTVDDYGVQIIRECLLAFFKYQGWTPKHFNSTCLLKELCGGGIWQIPEHIHDEVCSCQNINPKKIDLSVKKKSGWDALQELNLPTDKNPTTVFPITYFAEVNNAGKVQIVFTSSASQVKARAILEDDGNWHVFVLVFGGIIKAKFNHHTHVINFAIPEINKRRKKT